MAELATRSAGAGKAEWVDATGWTGEPNQALVLPAGGAAEFKAAVSKGSWLSCRVRTVEGGDAQATMRIGAAGSDEAKTLSVNGQWKKVRIPLRAAEAAKLRIECQPADGGAAVAVLEPCLMRRQGIGYATRLVFRNLRHLGPQACLRKAARVGAGRSARPADGMTRLAR